MKIKGCILGLLLICGSISTALAVEIPIEDLSSNSDEVSAQPVKSVNNKSLTMEQKVAKLEQQVDNFVQMDSAGKIENLQEQVQQLRGELETQKHDIKLMRDQLNSFYQDLDRRIGNKNNTSTLVTAIPENDKDKNEVKTSAKSNLDGVPVSRGQKVISEEQIYQDGLKLIKNKKYNESIEKMQSYLQEYPSGKYSANAHYWLGEIYYMQSHPQKAATEFQTIVNIYPNSSKVPDAMLKMGIIYNERGEYNKAYKQFQQLKKQYPDSNAAQLASQQTKI